MPDLNAKKIIDEIVGKSEDFEANMNTFIASIGEYADLFKAKPPPRADRTFSNPRQTEFFRAASVVGTLQYRMMTSADPFFSLAPVNGDADYDDLNTLTHVFKTQLKFAKYRQNLLRACKFLPVFGTVICQEDYRTIGVSVFGRQIPVTVMMPRVLDQVMFDRSTTNIDEADWLSTADLTSPVELMRLASEVKTLNAPWNAKALSAAAADVEQGSTINPRVLDRIRRSGFTQDEAMGKRKELLMYYGKLDAANDGVEYVAALINRKHLVRFHANNFQHGRRPFRVAKWVDFDNALGYGLGSLLGNQHKAMDANRQKEQDLSSFNSYGMFKRRKNTVADEDMVIRPLQIIDVENMDDLMPIAGNPGAVEGLLRLDDVLKAEFRAASGASDTLQAIATDATATASSLAQTEAIRAASVHAEQNADSLVREHLENIHSNNVQNIRAPFNINAAGISKRVYPADLRIDVEIEAKVTTDKDFTPERQKQLMTMLQILTSTKSQHPDQVQISILPIVKELALTLGVNPSDVIMRPNMMPAAPNMGAADLAGLAGLMAPATGPGGVQAVSTPVGQTLTA